MTATTPEPGTVHTALAQTLLDLGVDTVFGLMGDANMLYIADFVGAGGRFISAVSESGAVSMADGYARVTGRPGVASVTHGPAATNTVTAIVEAARSASPVILLTGDPESKRGMGQRIDLAGIFSATGAEYHQVLRPQHVVADVASSVARALRTRRPVVINIPHDLMHARVQLEPAWADLTPAPPPTPHPEALETALGILATADRPVILAGRGAALSGARLPLEALAERLGAPLVTTASAKDLFDGNPYHLGIMGSVSTPETSEIVAASDCIAVFGASLSRHTTLDGELLIGKAVVRCDLSRASFDGAPADALIHADVAATATAMCEMLDEAGLPAGRFRVRRLGDGVLDRDPADDYTDRGTAASLDPRTAIIHLDRHLPADRVVVTDVGRFIVAPWRYLRVRSAADFTHAGGFGSIGLGIGTAIGAAVGSPGRLVIGVAGDGGAMMAIAELSTAARHRIPLVMVVLNDRAYGAEYAKFRSAGYDPAWCTTSWPSFVEMARSLGCRAARATTLDELDAAIAQVADRDTPLLIEIEIDPSVDPYVP